MRLRSNICGKYLFVFSFKSQKSRETNESDMILGRATGRVYIIMDVILD